jgi:putative copper resistance protein D
MLQSLPYWLHLLAAAVWVGSQAMMFAVIVPGLRQIEAGPRWRLMSAVTVRFGWLGGVALAVLVVTGIDNINRYSPAAMFDFRYGYILAVKVALVAVVVLLTFVHSLMVGPRLLRAQEAGLSAGAAPPEEARLRRQSMVLSSTTFVLSLAVLFCAALLRGPFAYHAA